MDEIGRQSRVFFDDSETEGEVESGEEGEGNKAFSGRSEEEDWRRYGGGETESEDDIADLKREMRIEDFEDMPRGFEKGDGL